MTSLEYKLNAYPSRVCGFGDLIAQCNTTTRPTTNRKRSRKP